MASLTTLRAGTQLTHEIEVRRSRFAATLARTDTVAQARALADSVRAASPGARHHCTAWIVAQEDAQPATHSSDDGEPAGTAGTPMLDVLRSSGLCNVTAVVTRWFGGVLLGTGGLVRAYSSSVSEALARAPKALLLDLPVVVARLSPAQAGRVEAELRASGARILGVAWGQDVVLRAAPGGGAPGSSGRPVDEDGAALRARILELTGGEARCALGERAVCEVDAAAPRP
jgi:uncharacterized YigZ family protein